jgi:glucosamine-6-phosphate deaminase
MRKNLFDHIDIPAENINIPDGTLAIENVQAYCEDYEQKISNLGGLDIQILGIGRTGHIGFNEPGSAPNSGTRLVTLDDLTRRDASRDFGGKENVPAKAITMGVGTIFKAKEIILMAWNEKKAEIVKKAVEGELSPEIPATYLQLSSNVEFVLDQDAASLLTRFDTPWLAHDVVWTETLTKKAVVWLSLKLGKAILKLTDDDYNNNGMAELVTEQGPAYSINIKIFNDLQRTITGWPGGKPNVDDSNRPERAEPAQKNVILFSPHPDDDVISMGGTFIRLADQGHNIHVAYQTSGNTAVWDDDVLRYLEFVQDFAIAIDDDKGITSKIYEEAQEFFKTKKPNQVDPEVIRTVKGLIRKGEAIAGARFVGLPNENIHFQNLPFYDRGKFSKEVSFEDDIVQTMELLRKVKPHQVFAAGDFADPHGTHKVCFDIILQALLRLRETDEWTKDCWLWLYRGAWHEYPIHEIEMAVPLSPQEVKRKRLAIFKHQSQKDIPVFPGDDPREFWVRAEDRTSETADLYHKLGLADYEAIEAFVRWKFD